MTGIHRLALAISAAAVLSVPQAVFAKISDSDLAKALNDARILGANYSVTARISGKELTLCTYINHKSSDLEKDCKINAVLLAKKAFDIDSELVRARILFYSYDRRSYQEVYVTTGDVKAYASGQTTNKELFDSLIIKQGTALVPGASAAATGAAGKIGNLTAAAGSAESSRTKPGGTTPAGTAKGATPLPICQSAEVVFYYPKNWIVKTALRQDTPGERKLAQLLCSNSTDDAFIVLRVHQEVSPRAQLNDDMRYWMTHNYQTVGARGTMNFGIGNYQAWQANIADKEGDRITCERHVYFWSPTRRVYSLELNCNRDEFNALNAQFGFILSTVRFRGLKK